METKSKKQRTKRLSAKEKRQEQLAANRKARMQWLALGGMFAATVILAVVLITIHTEGELFIYGGHSY